MKIIFIFTFFALIIVGHPSNADSMYLGLETHHFQRDIKGCVNESHDLIAYEHNSIHVGTYVNTHCRRSYLLGYGYTHKTGFGVDGSLVTGYPSKMHLIEGIIGIPAATYKYTIPVKSAYTIKAMGLKFIYIPTVLIGVSTLLTF